jgi:hypothetical protein
VRSKILGSRFVRFGLALVFGNRLVHARSASFGFFDMGANVVRIGFVAGLSRFERGGLLGTAQGLAGKDFDGSSVGTYRRRRRGLVVTVVVTMAMIVVFQIFKNITDIEEGIAVEADVHESRLHAGKDASDSAFVDATDEGKLFLALDVDLD